MQRYEKFNSLLKKVKSLFQLTEKQLGQLHAVKFLDCFNCCLKCMLQLTPKCTNNTRSKDVIQTTIYSLLSEKKEHAYGQTDHLPYIHTWFITGNILGYISMCNINVNAIPNLTACQLRTFKQILYKSKSYNNVIPQYISIASAVSGRS